MIKKIAKMVLGNIRCLKYGIKHSGSDIYIGKEINIIGGVLLHLEPIQ